MSSDVQGKTFEQRVEEMQDVISRFIEANKSNRSGTRVWDSNGAQTSSGASNSDGHHYIPGEMFRNAFMTMLKDQQLWPYMVPMVGAALESYSCHGSQKNINIELAWNALKMFDEKTEKCDCDDLSTALDDLYAVFYWSPFNIFFGPDPDARIQINKSNEVDYELSYSMNVSTIFLLFLLEMSLKNSVINVLTVRLYWLLLLSKPRPAIDIPYKEISISLYDWVGNYLKQKMELELNTEELQDILYKLRSEKKVTLNNGRTLSYNVSMLWWCLELENSRACETCMETAKNDKKINYNCKVKTCPFSTKKTKYFLQSPIRAKSMEELISSTHKILENLPICEGLQNFLDSIINMDPKTCMDSTVAEPILTEFLNIIIEHFDFSNFIQSSNYRDQFYFLISPSNNLNLDEFKKLKNNLKDQPICTLL